MNTLFKILPIEKLKPSPYQPRVNFTEKALKELAQSILTQGLIEPLVVRELSLEHFEIIAGERRWRASMLAGLMELPCLIGNYSDQQAATLSLIENIQRQDLNLIEEATGYQRLIEEFHFHQDEIASLVGKSRSHIANILRLLNLCESVKERIRTEQLSLGHARLLVVLEPPLQHFFAEQIIKNTWSVKQLEKKIKELKELPSINNHKKDRDIERLQRVLEEQMGAPVQIINDKEEGGWLQVKFFNNETLAGLLERLGLRYD